MSNDKPNKSKLLKLKPWLTVPETARHLSNIFNEEVNEADVLRLALDGHLKLSVYFVNGAYAHYGKVVSYDDVEWYDAHNLSNFPKLLEDLQNFREKYGLNLDEPIDEKVMVIKSLNIDNERYLNLDKEVKSITGVWDLPLIGNEILDIEHKYQNLTDGPEVTMRILDGTFVQETDDIMCQILERFDDVGGKELWVDKISEIENRLCAPDIIDSEKEQLEKELEKYKKKHERYLNRVKEMEDNFYHEDNFYPADKLPDDSVLVVRTQALMDLVNSFSSEEADKGTLKFEVAEGTTWRGIRLVIRNNDHTEILEVNAPNRQLGNYRPEEIGFRGSSGLGITWTLLTQFAETNGTLAPKGVKYIKPTVSRLRKVLKGLFPGIDGDPIPWSKSEKSWRTAFHIELIRYEEE